jgi:hypothetical protein
MVEGKTEGPIDAIACGFVEGDAEEGMDSEKSSSRWIFHGKQNET